MSKFLFTADLHLTNRPCDEYRWEIFDYLAKQATNRKAEAIVILGDLTDLKDNHNSKLVNRIVEELLMLADVVPVYILMGNHDYVDPECPYFRFLAPSKLPIRFIYKREQLSLGDKQALFLPHVRSWRSEWGVVGQAVGEDLHLKNLDYIFIHQPVEGSIGSGGHAIEGFPAVLFSKERCSKRTQVIAGDIHVPQVVGNITYCGAPYPINFGDDYKPRILFHETGKELVSIPHTTIKKTVLTLVKAKHFKTADLTEGDMVRVILRLPRSEFVEWDHYKKKITEYAKRRQVVLCGIELKEETRRKLNMEAAPAAVAAASTKEILSRYCEAHKVEDELVEAAERFL